MTSSTHPAADAGTITIGNELTVNRLGFGGMRITGEGVWGDPKDVDEAKAVLRRAVDLGVTFFDTADSYGPDVSERLIGEALAPYADGLVIASKGGMVRSGPGQWKTNSRPEHLREACEGSLRRLKLEQIPLYQWHRPDPEVPLEDSVGTLVELQKEGKIRHIGVSNVTAEQLRRAQALTTVVSVQNRYNIGSRDSDAIVDICAAESMVFMPWAPMQDISKAPAVQEVADRHGASVRQIVLAWLLRRSPAILPIPGTGSVSHLEDNLRATAIELSDEDLAALESISE